MSKASNEWQEMARSAAERIDRQRAAGEQLALLPDELPEPAAVAADGGGERGAGRPKGAKNKVSSQMRDYLAARGCRMPEDVLVQIAGLNSRDDVLTLAMAQTERVLAWAFDGAYFGEKSAPVPTASMRLETFNRQYTIILRAAEAMLAYVAPKVSPDVNVQQNTTVIMPAAPSRPADPGSSARDVTPQKPMRMLPADVRHKMQQEQALKESDPVKPDAENRTEGPST